MLIDSTTIVLDGDPVLRRKADLVQLPLSEEDKNTLTDMIEYVRNSHDEEFCKEHNVRASVGIAAPQIAVSKQMLAISIMDEDGDIEFALVNPKIISNSTQKAYLENGESCLSVNPDREGYVPRYAKITVRAYNMLTDRFEDIRLKGYPAIVMQHEMDHLKGKLYYDHINPADPWQEIEGALVI
ncbi:MAG: peptide deformylase [Erysipelotrichaceae bacterium]|nr:peptide deformylase [Erysipelotrichaceae bacterium]